MAYERTVCWDCYQEVGHTAECPQVLQREVNIRRAALKEHILTWLTVFACAALVAAVVSLFGCTPAQQQTLGSLASNPTTVTTLKIAACIQGAMAEEEQERLRQRREAERLAAEEAEAIADAAREHPGSVKDEVEKVLKDGAK